jgi:hypothetical protein
MAVNRTGGAGNVGGPGVIRPLYGVFVRDQVASYRNMLGATLKDLKAGIKAGDPKAPAVRGDGKLEGIELSHAKKAAVAVDKAMKALKPVFGSTFAATTNDTAGRNALGRSAAPPGRFIAMYGVILADDLRKYRTSIQADVAAIQAGIKSGELKGTAKTEGAKALKSLQTALKALGSINF